MYSNFSKYGEAFKSLLSKVFTGDVIMASPETAFSYAVKQTDNKVKLPLISFYPDSSIALDNKNNSMPSYNVGMSFQNPLNIYDDNGKLKGTNERLAKNVKFLYIIIGYQIDVWAITRLEAEEVMQELLFWLYDNQQVEIEYQGVNLLFTFTLGNEILDNSDLVAYQTNGKLYRYTYGIQIQAALLKSENYFTVLNPNVKVDKMN